MIQEPKDSFRTRDGEWEEEEEGGGMDEGRLPSQQSFVL